MFIAALFATAETRKPPKCPSTDEWIKKMWYVYTVEYYSAIKKNEIMSFAATWMQLEISILSRSERQIPYDITYIWNLKYDTNALIYETEQNHGHREQTGGGGCQVGGGKGDRWSGRLRLADVSFYV